VLARRIARRRGERVHLVGHSLGGLLALESLRALPSLIEGRVVCLGSPLAGSRAARALSAWPATRWITGASRAILCDGIGPCTLETEVGAIAGVMPFGFGGFVAKLPRPNDGTVALDETRIEGLKDHCTVHATHTGLVFSAEAARQVVHFLREGRFEHAAAG
jgi:pimeloyl-ACP methyl ester carboxylesterase